jgi:D-3-phosphoglycerate dehydrogenase / 2-oxoglutarate reductase
MFKVQTLNAISPIGLNQFPRELYEVSSECQHPDALLVRSQSLHHFVFPKTVKVVGRAGAGVNNIPTALLTKMGIPVFNTPGANANAVCELVIAGMLLASRHLCDAWDYVRRLEGSDLQIHAEIENNKKQFVGYELMGKTLGIIGLGNIGVKVANAAIKLGMRVIGYDPTITVHRAWELSSDVKQAHNIDDVLMQSDFVSFHVPLTDDTKNMINAERLMIIKKDIVVLNFSRDGIIEHSALNHALNEQRIHAYVTDFPSVQFKHHPRVISLPHLGASTKEAEENCALMIVKQISDFLENGTITHSVNFPSIEMLRNKEAFRLAIVNINIPNMVAQISSRLASTGMNIVSLLNKSRDEIAYTLIDVNTDISDPLLKEISNIKGVVQVRKL